MRMNGNYKILSPFEGRYNLHVSPNCTLNLSTKQSFDKACVKEENRTRKVRSIFRKHFLPKLNVIKVIVLLRSFKENSLICIHFPQLPTCTRSFLYCFEAMTPFHGQCRGWQKRPGCWCYLDLMSNPSSTPSCNLEEVI